MLIDIELNLCESIGSHLVTLRYDIGLSFQRRVTGMRWSIVMERNDVSRKDVGPIRWPWDMPLTLDFNVKLWKKAVPLEYEGGLTGDVSRLEVGPTWWIWVLTSPMALILHFLGHIAKKLYCKNM